jgi:FKBP-type peptidyl-prolyl cis-trans isomerase
MKKLNKNEWVAVAVGLGVVVFMLFGNHFWALFNQSANTNNNVVELPQEGVVVQDFVNGQGEVVATGDVVVVHYIGRLTDGKVFDSSVDRNTPFQFTIGRGEVIRGWDEGLVGMRVGGQRRLVIAPNFAYGDRGVGTVPPNSTLVFDVQLLEVRKATQ